MHALAEDPDCGGGEQRGRPKKEEVGGNKEEDGVGADEEGGGEERHIWVVVGGEGMLVKKGFSGQYGWYHRYALLRIAGYRIGRRDGRFVRGSGGDISRWQAG